MNSKIVYHGSAFGNFTAFDAARVDNAALYGPGFYFTENKSVASTYQQKLATPKFHFSSETIPAIIAALQNEIGDTRLCYYAFQWETIAHHLSESLRKNELMHFAGLVQEHFSQHGASITRVLIAAGATKEEATPAVLECSVAICNPFDADTTTFKPSQLPAAWLAQARVMKKARRVYDYADIAEFIPKKKINEWLGALGYDGITHIGGGRVVATGVKHRVWIAFSTSQIEMRNAATA